MIRRRFRRRPRPQTLAILVVLVAVLVRLWQDFSDQHDSTQKLELAEGSYRVIRVVDGDTLIVTIDERNLVEGQPTGKNKTARVRLISIDAPESVKPDHPTEPWSIEATEFTERFVSEGHVRLRFDRRRQDRFGRWLAYVYVGDQMLNEELVRAGLAKVKVYRGDSTVLGGRLELAEQVAKKAKRGMWSNVTP